MKKGKLIFIVALVGLLMASCGNVLTAPDNKGSIERVQSSPDKYLAHLTGTPWEMGYQHGWLMAEQVVTSCSDQFIGDIFLGLAGANTGVLKDIVSNETLMSAITGTLYAAGMANYKTWVPAEYRQEIEGVFRGAYDRCNKEGWDKKQLSVDRLAMLNCWIDFMIAWIYGPVVIKEVVTGGDMFEGRFAGENLFPSQQDSIPPMPGDMTEQKLSVEEIEEIRATLREYFGQVHMCDGIAINKENSATGEPILTRSFMIPAVFGAQSVMMEYTPRNGNKFLQVSPPGMIGTGAGMNSQGLSIGVDMVLTGDLQQLSIGMGCLLKNREALQYSSTIDEAVRNTFDEKNKGAFGAFNNDNTNGTSWIHPIADRNGAAAIEISAHNMRVRRIDDDFTTTGYGEGRGMLFYDENGQRRPGLDWNTMQDLINLDVISQWENDPNLLVFTNHFVHPDMRSADKHRYPVDCTARYNFLLMAADELLTNGDRKISVEEAKHLVAYLENNAWNDSYRYVDKPLRWSNSTLGNPSDPNKRSTMFGGIRAVFDVGSRTIHAAFGPSNVSWDQAWQSYTFN